MASLTTSFLRTLAGGSRDLEKEEIHSSTRVLYTGKGLLLLVVSTVSAVIAGNTWGSVFRSVPVGVLAASLWFFASLALNLIISWKLDQSHFQGGSRRAALTIAAMLGFVIASVNTTFILMKTYESEIAAYIEARYRDERAVVERQLLANEAEHVRKTSELREAAEGAKRQVRSEGEALVATLRAEVSQLRSRYETAVNAVTVEVDGRGRSRRVGEGPRAKAKRQESAALKELLDAAVLRLDQESARVHRSLDERVAAIDAALTLDLAGIEQQRKTTEGRLDRTLREMDNTPRDGFLHRYTALRAVAWQELWGSSQFLALFFLLEIMVVSLKLVTGKTDYHMLRAAQWAKQENDLSKQIAQSNAERRERERAEREATLRHLEESAALDATERAHRLTMLEGRLQELRDRGASYEDVEKARRKGLRKGGFLRVVGQ
jgi:hypothetical protein